MARRTYGDGSVYKRGKTWAYQMPRELVIGNNRGYKGGFRTQREAADALRTAVEAARRGEYVKRAPDTFADYFNDVFLPHVQATRAYGTYRGYVEKVGLHVLPHIGNVKLQELASHQLERLWNDLLAGKLGRPALSPESVNIVFRDVRCVLNHAKGHGLIVNNPAERSNPPRPRRKIPSDNQVWTVEQIDAFLKYVREVEGFDTSPPAAEVRVCRGCGEAQPLSAFAREPKAPSGHKATCKLCMAAQRRSTGRTPTESPVVLQVEGDGYYPCIHVAARTGLRVGEVCGLRWQDVDLDGDTPVIRVRNQYTRVSDSVRVDGELVEPGRWDWTALKTATSRRDIPITADTADLLRALKRRQAARRLAMGGAYRSDLDVVFALPDGQPMRPNNVSRQFTALVKNAPVPNINFHYLRHSVGTALSAIDPASASQILGHYDVAFTLQNYVHPSAEKVRDVLALAMTARK